MAQRVTDDPVSEEYTTALSELWSEWEPAMKRVERSLVALQHAPVLGPRFTEPAEIIAQSQYRAHVTAERALGLMPPLVAFEAHRYFVEVLGYCRDTLGALAVADEMTDELDEHAVETGLQALRSSRDAFQAAQYASYAVVSYPNGFYPGLTPPLEPEKAGVPRWMMASLVIGGLTVMASSLFVLLLLGPGQ